MLHKQPK